MPISMADKVNGRTIGECQQCSIYCIMHVELPSFVMYLHSLSGLYGGFDTSQVHNIGAMSSESVTSGNTV